LSQRDAEPAGDPVIDGEAFLENADGSSRFALRNANPLREVAADDVLAVAHDFAALVGIDR